MVGLLISPEGMLQSQDKISRKVDVFFEKPSRMPCFHQEGYFCFKKAERSLHCSVCGFS